MRIPGEMAVSPQASEALLSPRRENSLAHAPPLRSENRDLHAAGQGSDCEIALEHASALACQTLSLAPHSWAACVSSLKLAAPNGRVGSEPEVVKRGGVIRKSRSAGRRSTRFHGPNWGGILLDIDQRPRKCGA